MKRISKTLYRVAFFSIVSMVLGACTNNSDSSSKTKVEESAAITKKYEANWTSLSEYKIPEWYSDAKFGIFIHWGPYAVPAFASEWYPRLMYMDTATFSATLELQSKGPNEVFNYHRKYWGDQKKFGYKDFIPMFKAENFDANEWISVFKKSGAKYVVPVAEHHDGFAMYNSKHTRWNAVKMGPQRDVLGELFEAGRKQGLYMGASSHFAFNWSYYNKKDHFDTVDPSYSDLYSEKGKDLNEPVSDAFKQLWWNRTTDIIDSYQPDIMWFDFYWDSEAFKEYHPKMAAYLYNSGLARGKEVVLQNKNHHFPSFPEGTIVYDLERGKMAGIKKQTWQTDTSIGKNSWCYTKGWQSKDANTLVDDLIDIVSKNGTMLLNIGPKADGTIPEDQKDILLAIGKWLDVNGKAIFGTRCWKTFGEGPTESEEGYFSEKKKQDSFLAEDIRFTTKDGKLYAITMDWPASGQTLISSLAKQSKHCRWDVVDVKMLGSDQKLKWSQNEKGLSISLPKEKPCDFAYTFEIDFGKNAQEATKNYIVMKEE
ncbi:MAG: alpha-L-fucosidase [Bacteroidota bacterium]